ncbi:MAG: hypothetical protein OSJ56_02795, partial [Prevotella sp.]|nr:hypothetical protein [Prevotella sp.]
LFNWFFFKLALQRAPKCRMTAYRLRQCLWKDIREREIYQKTKAVSGFAVCFCINIHIYFVDCRWE